MAAFGIVGDKAERPDVGRIAAIDASLNQRQISGENRDHANDRDWGAKLTSPWPARSLHFSHPLVLENCAILKAE